MSILDLLLILATIIGGLMGFKRGLIEQMGQVAAMIAALLCCRAFGGILSGALTGTFGPAAPVASSILMFVIVYFGVSILARSLKIVSRALLMGPLDRLAGALFGIFKWWLALSVLANIWLLLNPETDMMETSSLAGGALARFVVSLGPWLWGVMGALTAESAAKPA